jgi:hypothetical protein
MTVKWADATNTQRDRTEQANTAEAEQQANQAVSEAIVQALNHDNPAREVADLIRVAQTASVQAFSPDKKAVMGKHRLQGPDMTVDTLLAVKKTEADHLCPEKRYSAVKKTEANDKEIRPMAICVHYKVRIQMIPVLQAKTLENVFLANEMSLDITGEWKLYDRNAMEVISKEQLIRGHEYWVRQKEQTVLTRLITTDDRTVYLGRLTDELGRMKVEHIRPESRALLEEQSTRITNFGRRMQAELARRDEDSSLVRHLEEIKNLRTFKAPTQGEVHRNAKRKELKIKKNKQNKQIRVWKQNQKV